MITERGCIPRCAVRSGCRMPLPGELRRRGLRQDRRGTRQPNRLPPGETSKRRAVREADRRSLSPAGGIPRQARKKRDGPPQKPKSNQPQLIHRNNPVSRNHKMIQQMDVHHPQRLANQLRQINIRLTGPCQP